MKKEQKKERENLIIIILTTTIIIIIETNKFSRIRLHLALESMLKLNQYFEFEEFVCSRTKEKERNEKKTTLFFSAIDYILLMIND